MIYSLFLGAFLLIGNISFFTFLGYLYIVNTLFLLGLGIIFFFFISSTSKVNLGWIAFGLAVALGIPIGFTITRSQEYITQIIVNFYGGAVLWLMTYAVGGYLVFQDYG